MLDKRLLKLTQLERGKLFYELSKMPVLDENGNPTYYERGKYMGQQRFISCKMIAEEYGISAARVWQLQIAYKKTLQTAENPCLYIKNHEFFKKDEQCTSAVLSCIQEQSAQIVSLLEKKDFSLALPVMQELHSLLSECIEAIKNNSAHKKNNF